MKSLYPKPRIRQTAWGNWYGYLGTRRVIAFGNGVEETAQQQAERWLAEQRAAIAEWDALRAAGHVRLFNEGV